MFDFDGTLVHQTIDFARMREDVSAVVRRHGVDDPEILGMYVLELIDAACAVLEQRSRPWSEMRAEAFAAIEAVEVAAAESATPFPGVRSMLQSLRDRGVGLGIITRNSARSARTAFLGIED